VLAVAGLLLITNCEAGGTDDAAVDSAVGVLAGSYDVEVVQTADLDQVASALAHRGDRSVAVVGGDGTLHAVVEILHRIGDLEGTPIGVIPQGTGNDLVRTLGLPFDSAEAAGVIASGRLCQLDLLVDSADRVVVNAVHAGIGAHAGSAARPWKWLGKVGYVIGAVIAGLTAKGDKIRVIADGNVLADGRRRLLQVGIGNGAHIGGGYQLTPDADPTDGLADVLVSFAVRPVDRLLYALHLRRGTHEERNDVFVTQATSVTLSGTGFWCDADGELQGPITGRTWTVRRSMLTLFCLEQSTPARSRVPRP
jgi:diacylglycerol kinase (ATP)